MGSDRVLRDEIEEGVWMGSDSLKWTENQMRS